MIRCTRLVILNSDTMIRGGSLVILSGPCLAGGLLLLACLLILLACLFVLQTDILVLLNGFATVISPLCSGVGRVRRIDGGVCGLNGGLFHLYQVAGGIAHLTSQIVDLLLEGAHRHVGITVEHIGTAGVVGRGELHGRQRDGLVHLIVAENRHITRLDILTVLLFTFEPRCSEFF